MSNYIGIPINLGGPVTAVPAGQGLTFDPATNTWTVVSGHAISDPQFTGIDSEAKPKKKNHSDGYACKKCKDFFPYAEPNQEDGTLVCYACRHGL